MSKSFVVKLPPLTIPSGAAVSNTLNASDHYGDSALLAIQAPAALDAVTYSWQGSQDGTTFATIQDGVPLADLPVPAAGKAATYSEFLAFKFIRLFASGNAAADRTFLVSKHFTA